MMAGAMLRAGLAGLLALLPLAVASPAGAQEDPQMRARIQELVPGLETLVADSMKAFDVPGVAIGIVAGDELVYAKGFGVRSKGRGGAVGPGTVFQIASLSKAFLSATAAIAVDHGQLKWDDRVVDLAPGFQLQDPWVTREFRLFDTMSQSSGLPYEANDKLGYLGFDGAAMVRSLRHVGAETGFRTSLSYLNIPHILAGDIVAAAEGARDWGAVVQKEIFDPLGMKRSSYSQASIEADPDHAQGHRSQADGSVEIPFTWVPYRWWGAGGINSTVEDMASWMRLQLGNGTFAGKRIVSPENLAVTRTPRVQEGEKSTYALGWSNTYTPNGTILWHDGGADGFGTYLALQLDRKIGVVVLSNAMNVGFPFTIGPWVMDRLMGNAPADHYARWLAIGKSVLAKKAAAAAKPAGARPSPPIAPFVGRFVSPVWGESSVAVSGDALVLTLEGSGARLQLEPWDGGIFQARLLPEGAFKAIAESQGGLFGHVRFPIDPAGQFSTLEFTVENGQSYPFRRK
jgi:CubicO group peptidase (beta-lactamase class C family)